jgi:hypothetical protein
MGLASTVVVGTRGARRAPERPPTSLARARRRLAGDVVIGSVDYVGAAMLDLEPMRIPMTKERIA